MYTPTLDLSNHVNELRARQAHEAIIKDLGLEPRAWATEPVILRNTISFYTRPLQLTAFQEVPDHERPFLKKRVTVLTFLIYMTLTGLLGFAVGHSPRMPQHHDAAPITQ